MTTSQQTSKELANELANELIIGLVSVSDRASGGVYEDKGIPALQDWLAAALTTPFRVETRLIPDERAQIEQTLAELVDVQHLRTLIRNARKEQAESKPPKAYRELFQILKDLSKQDKKAASDEETDDDEPADE